jgi:hypothetical protein
MFRGPIPPATALHDVPGAQLATENLKESAGKAYRTWAKGVSAGVHKIIAGSRGQLIISEENKTDLETCCKLLECKQELVFNWNISMYTHPQALGPPRNPSREVGHLQGDYNEPSDDEEQYDLCERPKWSVGEVHLVALESFPHIAVTRFFF